MAPFPNLRYPLEEFTRENRAEEDRCLEQVRREKRREGGTVLGGEQVRREGGRCSQYGVRIRHLCETEKILSASLLAKIGSPQNKLCLEDRSVDSA